MLKYFYLNQISSKRVCEVLIIHVYIIFLPLYIFEKIFFDLMFSIPYLDHQLFKTKKYYKMYIILQHSVISSQHFSEYLFPCCVPLVLKESRVPYLGHGGGGGGGDCHTTDSTIT